MRINRENYEKFFVEYLDGSLDQEGEQLVLSFLQENPDLKAELEVATSFGKLQPHFVEYKDKSLLKRREHEYESSGILQEQMIAMIEGELDAGKKIMLQNYLSSDTTASKDFGVFQKTILVPDRRIVYPGKNHLKRQTVIPMFMKVAAIAALLVLFLFVYDFNSPRRIDVRKPIKTGDIVINDSNSVDKLELQAFSSRAQIVPREEIPSKDTQFLSLENVVLKKIFGVKNLGKADDSIVLAIADAGVNQFNKLSRKKIFLKKSEDHNGQNDKIHIKIGRLEFETSLAAR
jgi:hypothetical protein